METRSQLQQLAHGKHPRPGGIWDSLQFEGLGYARVEEQQGQWFGYPFAQGEGAVLQA